MAAWELTEPIWTERLVLRAYTAADFDPLYAMRSNAEVARYLYWEPQTEAEGCDALARKSASTSLQAEVDVLALAAEERTSGALVADVILAWASSEHATGE